MTWVLLAVIAVMVWWQCLAQRDIIVMLGCYKEMSDTMRRLLTASRDDDAEWDRLARRHAKVMHARGLRFGPYDELLMYQWHRKEAREFVET